MVTREHLSWVAVTEAGTVVLAVAGEITRSATCGPPRPRDRRGAVGRYIRGEAHQASAVDLLRPGGERRGVLAEVALGTDGDPVSCAECVDVARDTSPASEACEVFSVEGEVCGGRGRGRERGVAVAHEAEREVGVFVGLSCDLEDSVPVVLPQDSSGVGGVQW